MYFEEIDNCKEDVLSVDIRPVFKKLRSSLFSGICCAYTNLYSEDKDHMQTYEWYHSSKRGMTNMLGYETGKTNLVVTTDKLMPSKVIEQAQSDKCPIVSVAWLHLSMHLNTLLPYELFTPKSGKVKSDSAQPEEKTKEAKDVLIEGQERESEEKESKITKDLLGNEEGKDTADQSQSNEQKQRSSRHDEYIATIKEVI